MALPTVVTGAFNQIWNSVLTLVLFLVAVSAIVNLRGKDVWKLRIAIAIAALVIWRVFLK